MKKTLVCTVVVFGVLCVVMIVHAQRHVGLRQIQSVARSNVVLNGKTMTIMSSVYCLNSIEGTLLLKKIIENSLIVPPEDIPHAFVQFEKRYENECGDDYPVTVHEILTKERGTMFEK